MKKLLLALSIMIFTGCGEDPSQKQSQDTIQNTIQESSGGVHFEWDFSKQRKFIYSYSQEVEGMNKIGEEMPASKTSMKGLGKLNIRVKENNLADMSLTDLEMKRVIFDEDGNPNDTMISEMPIMVVQDMKPDGIMGDSNTDALFMMMFPLPKNGLKEGASEELPMKMPFNANGSRLFVKGKNTLTFEGYEEIEGRNCAVLKGMIDISDLEVPEELEGEYSCATTGEATYYFDLEHGYYVGADVQVLMGFLIKQETDSDNDFGTHMEMRSENVIKIRLEKIEE